MYFVHDYTKLTHHGESVDTPATPLQIILSLSCKQMITFCPFAGKKKQATLRELEEFRWRPIRDAVFGKQDARFLFILTEGKIKLFQLLNS